MGGDSTVQTVPSDKQAPPERGQSSESAWSKVAQDLNAPGTKIDKNNSDLGALNSSLKQNHIPNIEITGMQANNDQLPGTGHHTEAVQMTENGKQINSTYNPDTHQLTYQRQGANGPENVTTDMVSGQETTVIGTGKGSKGDGSTNGDVTVVRNHPGGDVTGFKENVNGKEVSLLGPDGKPLPGLSADNNDLHKHPPDVQVDASTGKVQSYETSAGVKVTLGDDGKPSAYNSNGFAFEHHKDGWYYHQDGSDTWVQTNEPNVAKDGTIHCQEKGGWNDGREHSLTGDGERTGDSAADRSDDPARIILDDHPKTIEDVLEVMRKLENALPDSDGLKYFTKMYIGMTQDVKDGLDNKEFKDPKYMEKFDVNFANLFIDAVKDNLQGKSVPEAWQAVFDARHKEGVAPIQDAMAGMMAHIDHDLPYALVQTNNEFGINPGKDSPEYADFRKINDLIAKEMPAAKKMLNEGGFGELVNHGGALGDMLSNEGITRMRDLAWDNAQRLQAGGVEGSLTGTALNQVSGEIATQILNPGSIPIPGVGDIQNPVVETIVHGAETLLSDIFS